jgi:hypothetical protein
MMRVFKDEGVVESAPGVPLTVVTPWGYTDLSRLRFTQSADVLFVCHPSYQTRVITRTSHTAWTISTYDSIDGPYLDYDTSGKLLTLSGITSSEKITSSNAEFAAGDIGKYIEYEKDGVPVIGYITALTDSSNITVTPKDNTIEPLPSEVTCVTLAAGVLTVSHAVFDRSLVGGYIKVVGTAAPGWYLVTAYAGTNRYVVSVGTILTMHTVTGILTPHDRVDTATLTASGALFVSTDVGRHVRLNFTGQHVWCKITAYSSTTVVSVSLGTPMPLDDLNYARYRNNARTKQFRLGAWSTTTGWPRIIAIHEQRLCFAGNTTLPQTLWMSKSGDYYTHSPTNVDSTVADDSGITYTIGSTKMNAIMWMLSNIELLIGTVGGEWGVRASSQNEAITPTNITVSEYTTFGSSSATALRAGNAVIFIQRSGNKLRELAYDFNINSFVSRDLTMLSEHILRRGGGAVHVEYQKEPNSTLWILLADGTIATLTYIKDQEVYAWATQKIAGSFGAGGAVVESVTSVPGISGEHTVYLVVKRMINSATKRYIEFIHDIFRPKSEQDKNDMFFVDSGLSYSGAPVSSVSGLAHLEGQTVGIVADGTAVPDAVVTSGSVSLPRTASVIHVGLQYTSTLKTLPMEGGGDDGTGHGKIKRIDKLTVRVMDSLGFSCGRTLATVSVISFRKSDGLMNKSPGFYTGDFAVNFDQGYVEWEAFYILQTQPYPLTLLALMPQTKVYSR